MGEDHREREGVVVGCKRGVCGGLWCWGGGGCGFVGVERRERTEGVKTQGAVSRADERRYNGTRHLPFSSFITTKRSALTLNGVISEPPSSLLPSISCH